MTCSHLCVKPSQKILKMSVSANFGANNSPMLNLEIDKIFIRCLWKVTCHIRFVSRFPPPPPVTRWVCCQCVFTHNVIGRYASVPIWSVRGKVR